MAVGLVLGHRPVVPASESMFGQPDRVVNIVTDEWEERSPWAPLAARRGVPGDAVTAASSPPRHLLAAMGTADALLLRHPDRLPRREGRSADPQCRRTGLAGLNPGRGPHPRR